jgi:hypothetical protein
MNKELIEIVARYVKAVTIDRACDASDVSPTRMLADIAALMVEIQPDTAETFREAIKVGIKQSAYNFRESIKDFQPCTEFKIKGV